MRVIVRDINLVRADLGRQTRTNGAHWDYKGGDLASEIKYIFMFSNEVTRLYKGK